MIISLNSACFGFSITNMNCLYNNRFFNVTSAVQVITDLKWNEGRDRAGFIF